MAFTSGKLNSDGAIAGNDNDSDARRYEPHHLIIERQEQVQIYEAIMVNHQGQVTTGLLAGVRYIKDNRLLPIGFDTKTAPKDIAVRGAAAEDGNFTNRGDRIFYSIRVDKSRRPFSVEVKLRYQPIGYRWAKNLHVYRASETERFVRYYDEMAQESDVILAQAQKIVE